LSDGSWHVYVIRCGDGSLYTGVAVDVGRRFDQHLAQRARAAKYLRGRGPLELVYRRAVGGRGAALKIEGRIKRLPKERKERLIARDADLERQVLQL
jgi:putative endonuclease